MLIFVAGDVDVMGEALTILRQTCILVYFVVLWSRGDRVEIMYIWHYFEWVQTGSKKCMSVKLILETKNESYIQK